MQSKSVLKSAGFTLVELMIAMILGLIVAGGSVALFVTQRVTNRQSGEMVNVQSESRIAMDNLARDIRAGADFGCWPVGTFTQALNNTTRFYPDNGGIIGFPRGTKPSANKAYAKDGSKSVDVPGADIVSAYTLDPNSDVIAIRGITGMLTELSSAMTDATGNLQLVTPASGQNVKVGDVLLVTDCKASSIFEVSSINSDYTSVGHVTNTTNYMGGGNSQAGVGSLYGKGSTIGRLDVVWWFVATINGTRGLYRLSAREAILNNGEPQLVSDLVNTLHLSYTYALTNNVPDDATDTLSVVTADGLNSAIAAGGKGGWFSVRNVIVNMLIRSAKPGNSTAVPFTFDGSQSTPSDRNLYLPMKMTVGVRNQ